MRSHANNNRGRFLIKGVEELRRGLKRQKAGDNPAAERLYRRVLDLHPDSVQALNLLGSLCINTGRAREAAALIERALNLQPRDAPARVNYALALKDLGQREQALEHLRQSLTLQPENAFALNCLGNLLLESHRHGEAIAPFRAALKLRPDYAECLGNLALALKLDGRLEEALTCCHRALELSPGEYLIHMRAAEILRAKAQYDNAVVHYKEARRLQPTHTAAWLGLANTYRESDRPDACEQVLAALLEVQPDNANAHAALGLLHEQLGHQDEAASSFARSIALDPASGRAHYQLAQLEGRKSSEAEIKAIDQLAATIPDPMADTPAEHSSENAMYVSFAEARVREQQGRYDEAFAAWLRGNAINAGRFPFDHQQRDQFYRSVAEQTKLALHRLGAEFGHRDNRPVFIVGMPRSGTTLTGQIIAAHSRVASLGEVSAAHDMTQKLQTLTGLPYPDGLSVLGASDLQMLGKDLVLSFPERTQSAAIVLDVTPTNFQHVGLLALALPQARFVHCVRDAIDTCFSIFKLPFGGGQDYAHDLTALGRQYSSYRALMDQWRDLFGDRILDVHYENTVSDKESQAREIFEFIGLPFESEVMNFHSSQQLVRTPSASQVRQPIYTDAVQAWRRYERHLTPLIKALRRIGVRS